MENKSLIPYLVASFIIALALVALSGFIGYKVGKAQAPEIVTTDTVTVVKIDTVVQEKPVPYAVKMTDTLKVHTVDTLYQPVTVQLPFEEKEYRDSLYRAIVSGFKPSLDYIEVYPKTVYKTVTTYVEVQKKQSWGLGLSGGYAAIVDVKDGRIATGPSISLGITWNLVSW